MTCFASPVAPGGVVIGDVCGKGPEAAAVTALVRHTVRAAAVQFRSPARALGALNDAMLRHVADGGPDRFVTAILGRFAVTASGVDLTLACGGHPIPMVRRATGAVEPAGRAGTLVGVLPRTEIHDTRLTLSPGDVIVMVTDGVLEARHGDDQFGDNRLVDVLAATHGATPEDTVDAVLQAVTSFQSGHSVDDIAIVAISAT
jgi:sigma-B regulation protein RsbU (phosphoserine phosphatase)